MSKKVLFVRFSSLGDIVLTTGVINLFHKKYPDIDIHFLTYEHFKEVLYYRKEISNILTIKKGLSLNQYLQFIQEHIADYDYIFDLHSNFRTFLFKIFTQIEVLSYKKKSLQRRLFVKFGLFKNTLNHHVVERYYESVNRKMPLGEYKTIEELRPVLTEVKNKENYIVFHPFASKKTKEWPYFDELAKKLVEHGEKIIVVGNGNFTFTHKNIENLACKTNLMELVNIISRAKLLITTDSGPMHIGIGCKTKTVSIFGSTTKEFGFYPSFKGCEVIEDSELKCRPCHVHGLEKCPKKHFKCMKEIASDFVFSRVLSLINS